MHQLMAATVTEKQSTDWRNYLQWTAAVVIIPIMAVIVWQHIKIRQLAQMIAIITALPKGHAFELLRPEIGASTTMATTGEMTTMQVIPLIIQQMISSITVVDTLMFSLLILLFLSLAISMIALWHYTKHRRSYIYLEAISPRDCIQIQLCRLPNATRNFALSHLKIDLKVRQLGCMAILQIQGNFQITNTLTDESVKAPKTFLVSASKAKIIKRIANHPQKQISFLACHSFEVVTLRAPTAISQPNLQNEQQFV
jgi:hypothetical protein